MVIYKCEWCLNTFYSMRNGFRAIFCSINNWNIQINKTIETGNKDSRNWLTVKCPKGMYVNGVTAKFGCEQQQDIGFVGMQLNCTDIDLNQSFKMEDTTKFALSDSSDNIQTNFVSSFSLKFIENGQLTGIKFGFEGIPIISGIDIKYGQILGKSNQTTIQFVKLENNGKSMIKKSVYYKNVYMNPNTFANNKVFSYYSIYQIKQDMVQPMLPSLSYNESENQFYFVSSQNIVFDKLFFKKFTPINTSMLIPITPLTNITVFIKTQQLRTTITYQAKLKLTDKFTGQLIIQKTITGVWSGVISGPITVSFEQAQCTSGWNNNFIVNGDFQLNKCTINYCIWNNSTLDSLAIGQILSPQIEVGKGFVYNAILGSSWISQLGKQNNCIKQKVKLGPGLYQLSYDGIARTGYTLKSSNIIVKFNGTQIHKLQPEDYNTIYRPSVQLSINETMSKQYWFQFCGNATDEVGGVIDNIKLYNDCLSTKTISY